MVLMKRMLILFGALLLLVAPVANAAPDLSVERILEFESRVAVQADGSLTVVERILVNALGDEIRRGIYRDFPTVYGGVFSPRVVVPFEVVSVTRDFRPEPHHIESISNGKRLYIGDADVFLPHGIYEYEITYRTDRQIGYFEDHDELYWNVTGNGWDFPIDTASARITLPAGIPQDAISAVAYTGAEGSREQEYEAVITESGSVEFVTTEPLSSYEGLTVAVSWPKGYVVEPTEGDRARQGILANLDAVAGGIGVLLVLVYFWLTWLKVGRDPEQGTVIPRYTPPADVSPAGARYLMRYGSDTKTFATALLSMAVQGAITIHEVKKFLSDTYSISRGKETAVLHLSPEEQKLYQKLLGNVRDTFKFEQSKHSVIKKAKEHFELALERQYKGKAFHPNRTWFAVGAALSVLIVYVSGFAAGMNGTGDFEGPAVLIPLTFVLVWASVWMTALVGMAGGIRERAQAFFAASGMHRAGKFFSMLGMSFVGLLLAIPQAIAFVFVGIFASWAVAFTVLILVTVNVAAFSLLRAPTEEGQRLRTHVEGFKLFLSVTEKDRLAFYKPLKQEAAHNETERIIEEPPELTFEVFEKYLPYALALGVEHEWAEKFSEKLAAAAAAGEPYAPMWYVGPNWEAFHTGSFAADFSSSFTNAISSASAAPGSSSGFGGGSSGGGGGGGGGGGW